MTGQDLGDTAWRVWTWPNLVTMVRLAGIPVFCYLLLATDAYVAAVVVLAVGGGTDWVDGFLARRLRQESRFGQILDPIVDRLYILVAVGVLTVTGLLPWLFTAVLLAREAVMFATVVALRRRGFAPLKVHYVGKTATFVVFSSLPVLVLAGMSDAAVVWARPLGWALAWWGITLYWLSVVLYLAQAIPLLREARTNVSNRATLAATRACVGGVVDTVIEDGGTVVLAKPGVVGMTLSGPGCARFRRTGR